MARLGKRERALKKQLLTIAENQARNRAPMVGRMDGLVSMDASADYGKSCANINPFNVQGSRAVNWEYNGRRTKHGKVVKIA